VLGWVLVKTGRIGKGRRDEGEEEEKKTTELKKDSYLCTPNVDCFDFIRKINKIFLVISTQVGENCHPKNFP